MVRLRLFSCLIALIVVSAACGGRRDTPAILFLRRDDRGVAQLYLQDNDLPAKPLTGTDDPDAPEVLDFAVSADGEQIGYAVVLDGANSALRMMGADGGGDGPLLDCPAAECSAAVWSPDGSRLVYERRPWEGDAFGSPRLHWLDSATGETLPLIEGNETPGYGARFSPDGTWISYVSPADAGIVFYRLADGEQHLLTSRVGSPAAFSPDSAQVVYGDMVVQGDEIAPGGESAAVVQESSSVYLYRTTIADDTPRERLSPKASVADTVPAWSPDGEWIAFGRAPANTAAGRQLWLMRPDGSAARALTADPTLAYGPPNWSPDGRFLLYQRYDLTDPAAVPSVWRMEVETGEQTLMAEEGYLPAWLP